MIGLHRLLLACPAAWVVATAGVSLSGQTRLALPASSNRAQHLATHVTEADLIRKAVIRGDLVAVREPARRLAERIGNPDMAPVRPAYTDALRQAARSGAEAPDLAHAAFASARIAAACGGCHVASGVHAALPTRNVVPVGGVVGHMVAHQQAADEFLAALVEPSDRLWQQAADHLAGAPLKRAQLPRDPKLGREVMAAEERIHQLAERASRATTTDERTEIYAQVLASCAECHSLHARVWGPATAR